MPKNNDKKGSEFSVNIPSGSNWTDNTQSDYVTLSKDKIKNILHSNIDHINRRALWLTPLGIFLTIVLSIISSDFKDFLISGLEWRSIFIVAGVASFIWLMVAIVKTIRLGKSLTVDELANDFYKNNINK